MKGLCKLAVLLVSGIFHEYVLSFAFGFFYPILFVTFLGLVVLIVCRPLKGDSSFWNILFFVSSFFTIATQISLFFIEWHTRNTPNLHNIYVIIIVFFILNLVYLVEKKFNLFRINPTRLSRLRIFLCQDQL